MPKGYEPPPRLTDHVCSKLDECERFVGDRCVASPLPLSPRSDIGLILLMASFRSHGWGSFLVNFLNLFACGLACRVHEMERFEGDVARVRMDSRQPAQTMTTSQLMKLDL